MLKFALLPKNFNAGCYYFVMAGVAQLVRAPVCGTGGRGFETHRSPHEKF